MNINRRTLGVACVALLMVAGLAWYRLAPGTEPESRLTGSGLDGLVLVTRGGCPATAAMQRNLDEALRSLGFESRYEVVDQDTLPESDVRRGYPTPTLLYANRDVFGMPVPMPPLPDPT